MSNIPDLRNLTSSELRQVIATAESLIDSKIRQERDNARREAEDLIRKLGFTPDDLFGNPMRASTNQRKRGEAVSAPKFRNPNNTNETWTGRGRKPKWFEELSEEQRKAAEIKG
ncbi:H-NS histone family protein [Gemmobacter sp.]|uniref:H-NS histone family protein n=1 Tax=Gemmobacter sp. TaxID=1898957 RepID=UPI002AFF5221|nr:H-NS histone family protein [Gemmobacter sp.]